MINPAPPSAAAPAAVPAGRPPQAAPRWTAMKLSERWQRLLSERSRRRAQRRSLQMLFRLGPQALKDIGLSPIDLYAVGNGSIFGDTSRRQR